MKELFKAINNVRSKVGTVTKNGKNTFHKYNYATANDVLHEVRDACNQEGLLFMPIGTSDFIESKDGQVESFTMHYTVAHVDSGEHWDICVRCAGEDKGDKKAYKANTGAMKYLFIQLFMLPTDDDPENDRKYPNKPKEKVRPNPVENKLPTLTKEHVAFPQVEKYVAENGWDKAKKGVESRYTVPSELVEEFKSLVV